MNNTKETSELVQASDPSKVSALGESFPLGPLDHLVSSAVPVAVCYIYPSHLSLDRLRSAIALLLDYYPHLTGRITQDARGIRKLDRLGSGALLVSAIIHASLTEYQDQDGRIDMQKLPGRGNTLLAPFDPAAFDIDPPLTVKMTRFNDGTVLGVRCHHMLCDGTGYFQLVGHLTRLYTSPETPLARPPVIMPYRPNPSGSTETSLYTTSTGPSILPGTPISQPPVIGRFIHLSSAYLATLKESATPAGGRTSTFAALMAHLWQMIHRARLALRENDPRSDPLSVPSLLISTGFRGRVPAIPPEYFANAVFTPNITTDSALLASRPLSEVCQIVNNMIRQPALTDPVSIESTVRWLDQQTDKHTIDSGFAPGNGAFMASQWSGFDMYDMSTIDGIEPVLVAPPFTPISLCDGLAYTLPPPKTSDGPGDGLMLALSLSAPLWDIIDQRDLFDKDDIVV